MCEWGDTVEMEVTVPAHLSHTGADRRAVKPIDRCLAPAIKALNEAGFVTAGCCCGHGREPASIIFADGSEIRAVAVGSRVGAP